MNQSTKILLGILTLLPFLLLMVIIAMTFGFVFGVVGDIQSQGEPGTYALASNIFPLIILASGAGLLSFGLAIYYIIHVMSLKGLDSTIQIVWVLILLFTSPIGSLVYWYMNIWNDPLANRHVPETNVGGYTN